MKNRVSHLLGIGLALAASAALHAQNMTANVPFPFTVGTKTMAAGAYRVGTSGMNQVVSISGRAQSEMRLTIPLSNDSRNETPRLVFQCYSGECFLSQVWLGGSAPGQGIPMTRRQRELAEVGVPARLAIIHVALKN